MVNILGCLRQVSRRVGALYKVSRFGHQVVVMAFL